MAKKPAKAAPAAAIEDEEPTMTNAELGLDEDEVQQPEPDPDSDLEIDVPQEPAAKPDPMEEMKKRLKEAEDKAAAAAREADELRGKAKGAIDDRFAAAEREANAIAGGLDSKIEAQSAKIEKLEAELLSLMDSGENAEAIKKQKEINKAQFELMGFEQGKAHVEKYKADLATAKEKAEVQNAVKTADDFAREGATADAVAWIKAHPKFQIDKDGTPLNSYSEIAAAAHDAAVRVEGLIQGSPEYLAYIEQKLIQRGEMKPEEAQYYGADEEEEGGEGDDEDVEIVQPLPPPPRKKQSTAAPGSSRSNASGATGKKRGRLTAEEAEAAKISGMTPEEYYDDVYGEKAKARAASQQD